MHHVRRSEGDHLPHIPQQLLREVGAPDVRDPPMDGDRQQQTPEGVVEVHRRLSVVRRKGPALLHRCGASFFRDGHHGGFNKDGSRQAGQRLMFCCSLHLCTQLKSTDQTLKSRSLTALPVPHRDHPLCHTHPAPSLGGMAITGGKASSKPAKLQGNLKPRRTTNKSHGH